MIVPDGHYKYHAFCQSFAHCRKTSLCCEFIGITKSSLLCGTERIGDGVSSNSSDFRLGIWHDDAVLNIKSSNFAQSAWSCSVIGNELSDHGKNFVGVYLQTCAVKGCVAHAVRIEVTTVSITKRRVSCANTTIGSAATSLFVDGTWMRSICSRNLVCFPNIHFWTAWSILSCASIHIITGRCPAYRICLLCG